MSQWIRAYADRFVKERWRRRVSEEDYIFAGWRFDGTYYVNIDRVTNKRIPVEANSIEEAMAMADLMYAMQRKS